MAACKKKKKVRQKESPASRHIAQGGDPLEYYQDHPAWRFADADGEMWGFEQKEIGEIFWTEILPRLKGWERQTWAEILVNGKKQNHSVLAESLNKAARDRLEEKHIEAEALLSLRLTGTHRLYGYMTGRVFHILWFDDDHGDNETCVCRARLKHT